MIASTDQRACRVLDLIATPDPEPEHSWLDRMDGLQRGQAHPPSNGAQGLENPLRNHRGRHAGAVRGEAPVNNGVINLILGVLIIILILVILRIT